MTAAALVEELRALGATVEAAGDRLVVDAPAGTLTPPLLAQLREQKRLILARLAAEDAAVAWRVAAMRGRHPHPWRFPPFLTVRDVPRGAGSCHSCGEPLQPLGDGLSARCAPCTQAARLVLDEGTSEGRQG